MIPAAFDYHRPASIDEAITMLRETGGKLLAGGHSLVPAMKFRLSQPAALIDIARIPGLAGIRELDGKIHVGAATVHHAIATSALIRQKCPALADAAGEIGDPQVRNRGTLGGSLAHADPAADYPAAILAIDAEIHIKGSQGWRVASATGFFKDLFTVDLAADEIIVSIQFTPVTAAAYAKLHQPASHFAIVGVAAALDVTDGRIESARIGLTGACSHATRLTNVEHALSGKPLSIETLATAARLAGTDLRHVNADIHASERYRRAMIPVFTRRTLEKAAARV